MPAHVTHLVFARDLLRSVGRTELIEPPGGNYLVFGAQGPDLFYHNQRRRPSGLAYGSLMHRRDYGKAVAEMWSRAVLRGLGPASWAAAWIVGFASHAVLDRHTHPFVNYWSGWADPGDPHTARFRSMHPFLERLIDVEVLRVTNGIHPNQLDFHGQVTCGDEPPAEWVALMTDSLCSAYPRIGRDSRVDERMHSAYLDAMGYYRFTNDVGPAYLEEACRRESDGEIGSRWMSIVHPPEVPPDLDVLNEARRPWSHPCDERERTNASFFDLFALARAEGIRVVGTILDHWTDPPEDGKPVIEAAVGNANLSDGRPTGRPCHKQHSAPLPLVELQARIRASIAAGDGGRLESR